MDPISQQRGPTGWAWLGLVGGEPPERLFRGHRRGQLNRPAVRLCHSINTGHVATLVQDLFATRLLILDSPPKPPGPHLIECDCVADRGSFRFAID